MNKKALIFDFDLTLADASQGIFQCVNHALTHLNYNNLDYNSVKKLIGHSLSETFKLITGVENKTETDKFVKLFTAQADLVMNNNTFLFHEVYNVIAQLKKMDYLLGIVSTKFRYRIEGVLKREMLLTQFDCIVGGEDVKIHKPHPEGLLLAIEKLEIPKNKAVYIGDTLIDAETTRAAGVDFIAVLSGTTIRKDFEDYGCKYIINNLLDLNSLLIKL